MRLQGKLQKVELNAQRDGLCGFLDAEDGNRYYFAHGWFGCDIDASLVAGDEVVFTPDTNTYEIRVATEITRVGV